MTDQPKTLLAKLEESFYIAAPQIERRQEAKDGTVKYLLRMADGNCIETVVMRYHYGNTVCVSTQVGCRTEGYWRAHFPHRAHGHRGTTGQL